MRILTVGFIAAGAASLAWFHAPGSVAAKPQLDPQAPVPTTIFIDAGVSDDLGRPVKTLRPEDVRVVVDGESRPVVSLRFVHRGPGAEAAAGLADPAREAPAAAERMRSVLLLVDENSIAPGQEPPVIGAVRRLLDELGAADQAAVVSLPRPPPRLTLTTDAIARQASLSRVTGRLVRDTPGEASQAAAPSVGKPPDVSVDTGAGDPEEQARLDALVRESMQAGLRDGEDPAAPASEAGIRGTTSALLGVIEGLRGLPGLKTVVVLRQAAPAGGTPDSSAAPASALEDRRSNLDATISAAARARAVIHLVTVGAGGGRRGASGDDLREVAEATGGTITIAKDNRDARAFDALLAGLSGGYLVEVDARDGDPTVRARPIKVEVTRPRTVVRAARWWAPRNDPVPAIVASALPPAPARPTAASPPAALPPPGEAARRKAADDPQLVLLLARVTEYLEAYVKGLSNVVAEEEYRQRLLRGTFGKTASRQLRSDLVIVRTDHDIGWLHYRDVFEVDGFPVRDRDARVQKLFLDDPEGAVRRGTEISLESARYNIGAMTRTVNWPTLALAYLGPSRIGGLSFRLDGDDTVDGIKAVKVAFEETASPSLVRPTTGVGDIPARGTFWIDPANGRILKTHLSAKAGYTVMTMTVLYKPMPGIGVWPPAEMDERYDAPNEEIEGHAVYRNFRQFTVTTDTKIK